MLTVISDLMFSVRIESALRTAGQHVVAVEPDAALDAEAGRADVALVDVGNARLDGGRPGGRRPNSTDVVARLRQASATLPIVAFGSHRDLATRERVLAAGATSFVARSRLVSDPAAVLARAAEQNRGLSGRPDGAPPASRRGRLSAVVRSARGFILDVDGVLWRGDAPLPGLRDLFDTLRLLDIGFVLATNNASRTPAHYVSKLAGFGVDIDPASVVTSAIATARYLTETFPPPRRVFAIGEVGLIDALRDRGYGVGDGAADGSGEAGIVVVGYDRGLTYRKLADATRLIRSGAAFVATNADVTFPGRDDLLPGVGATLAALSAATGVEPVAVGKPNGAMFEAALAKLDIPADAAVMLGDRIETDIVGAQRAGLAAVLVTTGVDDEGTVARTGIEPDAIAAGLPEIVAALK